MRNYKKAKFTGVNGCFYNERNEENRLYRQTLIRMTETEARQIIKEDNDFGDDGKLRDDFEDDVNDDGEQYLDDNTDEATNIVDEHGDD